MKEKDEWLKKDESLPKRQTTLPTNLSKLIQEKDCYDMNHFNQFLRENIFTFILF